MTESAYTRMLICLTASIMLSNSATAENTIRIVDCNQRIQSHKRGLCANKLSDADFEALAPGVSWYYNWSIHPIEGSNSRLLDFVPMIWGGGKAGQDALKSYLEAGNRPRAVLAINEPNLVEWNVGSAMTPSNVATSCAALKAITKPFGIPLVGPQMSIGSPPNMSVTAFDPIEKKEVTYTYMVPYLNAFFHYLSKQNTDIDAIGMHPYMPAAGIAGLMEAEVAKRFNRPIWITEFSNSDQPLYDMPYKLRDLMQAVDYMERTDYVQAYAYFKERNAVHEPLSLFTADDGELNELGKAYVQMPVHDSAIYYRLPGRLEAEKYTTMSGTTIWPTTDTDGFAHMSVEESGAGLNYQVYVPETGDYRLHLRVTGKPATVHIRMNDGAAATLKLTPPASGWKTEETTVRLSEGTQTLHLSFDLTEKPFGLNWISIEVLTPRNEPSSP